MRHACGDVEHVASAKDDMVLKAFTVPGIRLSAYHVDRGFVAVLVGFRPPTGWRIQENHGDARRASRLLGDSLEIGKARFAIVRGIGANEPASRFHRHGRTPPAEPDKTNARN